MSDETPIDRAHADWQAAPNDDTALLAFYERIGDAELFLLLAEEARDDKVTPKIFDLAEERVVLAFDREERLTAFIGGPAAYAALSGRVIASLLAEEGLGLGLNLDVAPSSFLLPASGVVWLAETLANAPTEIEAGIAELNAPSGLPERLISALDTRLAAAAGLAQAAYLVGTRYRDGGVGHLLGIVDAVPEAQAALAKSVGEALTFSGIEAGALDVAFFKASDPMAARLAKNGLRFDLPQPEIPTPVPPAPPGSDPDKPPRLK